MKKYIAISSTIERTKRNALFLYDTEINPLKLEKMGIISKEAIWVKQGDVFDENEVKEYFQPGGYGSETWNLVSVDIINKDWLIQIRKDNFNIFKIKGPCGHFH